VGVGDCVADIVCCAAGAYSVSEGRGFFGLVAFGRWVMVLRIWIGVLFQ